jgi:glycosyltransferase involved in cell wall biosynthesis
MSPQDAPSNVSVAVSIVMPAHNEEAFLRASVGEVVEGLRSRGRPFEVIVVENGSADATASLADELARTFPEVHAQSYDAPDYGRALRAGFLAARGEFVTTFDVDYYDLGFLDRSLAMMEVAGGPDIVVGSKRSEGARDTRPMTRKLVTAVFSTVLKAGFGLKVSDTHGVKVMRRRPLLPLVEACRFGTDLFDTELVLRAERAGFLTAEVPVVVEERRPSRTSIFRRVPRSLAGLARLRIALWRER